MKIILNKLHKKQREIVNNIIKSKAKFHTINASRQSGKTHLITRLIPLLGLLKRCDIMVVAPTYSQTIEVFDRINNIKNIKKIIKHVTRSKPPYIELINGSIIKFKSSDRPDNLRGGSYDYVICDEFRFFKSGVFEEVIRPTTSAKIDSKIIICSTPKGKVNDFFKYAMLGQSIDSEHINYEYYEMSYNDNHHDNGDPIFDLNEISDAKNILSEKLFAQEYLAQFNDGEGTPFHTIKCLLDNYGEKDNVNYAGLDLGKVNDSTVLHIVNKTGKTVFKRNLKGKDYNNILDQIILDLKKYNAKVLIETNGGQSIAFDYIKKRYSNCFAFNTNNSNKQQIIENLILALSDGNCSILNTNLDKELHNQINTFSFTYNPLTRRVYYQAQQGFHDDEVMSLAFAYECLIKYKSIDDIYYEPLDNYGY